MGLHRAGFDVSGVDIVPQPNYPLAFGFRCEDALTVPLDGYDFIWASPPCQAYSPLNAYNRKDYPDLVAPIRERLKAAGVPYVIENVPQAPLIDPVQLCGAMFGLNLYRHRNFEASFPLTAPAHPRHEWTCARNGYLPGATRPFMSIHGGKHSIAWRERAAAEMGVPWMKTIREVCEAIPPAYSEHIGRQSCAYLPPWWWAELDAAE